MENDEKENDDELNELLSKLSKTEPVSLPKKNEKDTDIVIKPRLRPKKLEVSIEDELMMIPEGKFQPHEQEDLASVFSTQLRKVASQYGSVFEEIINNYKKDREQAQEVIDQFMEVISAGGRVPRIYLEKIADVVRAKNEIAQTAIKALDSLPKLISATKGNDIFTNNVGVSFDSTHLKEILKAAEAEAKVKDE